MGGSESMEWLDDLAASYEAAVAREDELAAADLAFSFRQGGALSQRLGSGSWALVVGGELSVAVEEVGADYVAGGTLVVPAARVFLRSSSGSPPRVTDRTLGEVLGAACRAGAEIELSTACGTARGRLVEVGREHLVLRRQGADAVVGLGAVEAVRMPDRGGAEGYSASRGFSG